jgi:Family of unknown function (DUF5762)
MAERFWLESPCALFQSTVLLPTSQMTKAAVLNALTRLLLLVVAGLWIVVRSKLWLTVLVAGLVSIGLLYLFNVKGRQGFREDFRETTRPDYRRPTFHAQSTPTAPLPEVPPTDLRKRTGLVGTETRVVPRTSTVRLDDVAATVRFLKR